nr:unnamed protein product [Callosobruchus chinensis]
MIWHEHVSSIAGKKLGYLFRARECFSLFNLLTLYKVQIRFNLEYCSHIWGAAAPTTLAILDALQRRAIRLIGYPDLTLYLQPLSHRRAQIFKRILLLRADLYNSAALQACKMHFFCSSQGGRPSYIKTLAVRSYLCLQYA